MVFIHYNYCATVLTYRKFWRDLFGVALEHAEITVFVLEVKKDIRETR